MSTQHILKLLEELKDKVAASIKEIDDLDEPCKSVIHNHLCNATALDKYSVIKIQAIIDYMHEKVNIGNWKEVRPFLRKTITIASYLKLLLQVACANNVAEIVVKELFKTIDFGLLFGCPLDKEAKLLQNCASIINSVCRPQTSLVEMDPLISESSNVYPDCPISLKYNASPLEVLDCPSMEYFLSKHILAKQPVILDNCINHWSALQKWQDQNYFIKSAGLRTVSIELGSKYTDSDWTQKLMTMEEFIKHHIYQCNGPTGYLAQYQLFEQIPELKDDIVEPEYCCFTESNEPVDVMAWFGPKGTVSPLHHDPKRNLLAQVVGEKQIFLFAPVDSEYLYPHEHELLNNTAQVDPRKPDLEKFPNYKEAKALHCVLKPGQMLYIPPKWWHFVESLSISFSVSFWWE